MADFKALPPELIHQLLQGHQDVLTPAQNKEEAFHRHSPCPRCQKYGNESYVNPRQPFLQGSLLPNMVLRCLSCQTEWDPHSRFVFKALATDETDSFPDR